MLGEGRPGADLGASWLHQPRGRGSFWLQAGPLVTSLAPGVHPVGLQSSSGHTSVLPLPPSRIPGQATVKVVTLRD